MRTNAARWPVLSLLLALAAGDAQRNTSRTFAPGQCGPVDPTYIQTATETGGQPFFLSPAEIAKSAHIMLEASRPDDAMVLWASGTKAEGARANDGSRCRFQRRLTWILARPSI
jgi:hypothetical protein